MSELRIAQFLLLCAAVGQMVFLYVHSGTVHFHAAIVPANW